MNCDEAMLAISAKLDGELNPAELEALEAHLKLCPDCRALAKELEEMDAALETLVCPPPETLVGNVMDKIRAEAAEQKQPRRQKPWAGLMAVAAVAAVLLLGALGVIELPGLSGNHRATATIGDIFAGETDLEPQDVEEMALERDAAILAVGRDAALPDLEGESFVRLPTGELLYTVTPELLGKLAEALTEDQWELYNDQAPNALVLVLN